MSDDTNPNTLHPSLQDLGQYLEGLGRIVLERDRLRMEQAQAQAEREHQRTVAEHAARAQALAAQRQQERAQAMDKLRLLRQRHASLLDRASTARDDFDALLAQPNPPDPCLLLPEVEQALQHLTELLAECDKLGAAGMAAAGLQRLLPGRLLDAGQALAASKQWAKAMPQFGLGRFVKIGSQGEHLLPFASEWVAVLDTAHNLIWELKTEGGPHSHARRFTNLANGSTGDSSAYVAEVNKERFAGATDWRMPTIDELAQLYVVKSWLVQGWRIGGENDWYWSSSAAAGEYVWNLDFHDGNRYNRDRSYQNGVRLVRSGQ